MILDCQGSCEISVRVWLLIGCRAGNVCLHCLALFKRVPLVLGLALLSDVRRSLLVDVAFRPDGSHALFYSNINQLQLVLHVRSLK